MSDDISTADLLAKVGAMASKKSGRAKALMATRQEVWGKLQVSAPVLASAAVQVAKVFGKPAAVAVKFKGQDWVKVR